MNSHPAPPGPPSEEDPLPRQPFVFDELPFHIKAFILLRNFHDELTIPNRIVLWLAIVGLILLPAAYLARPLVRNWKQENTLLMARQFAANGDVPSAMASYRSALSGSHDAARWKEYGTFASNHQIPGSGAIWERVVELDPGDVEGWKSLIDSNLQDGNLKAALAVAGRIPASLNENPVIQISKASVFAIAKRTNDARAELAKASAAAATQDDEFRLRLALAQMDVGDPTARAKALEDLDKLSRSPSDKIRHAALAAILRNARFSKLRITGIETAQQIIADPTIAFSSRLDALSFLCDTNAPQVESAALTLGAKATPPQQIALVALLLKKDQGTIADKCIDSLSEALNADLRQIARLRAEVDLSTRDWTALVEDLNKAGISGENPALPATLIKIARRTSTGGKPIVADWNYALRDEKNLEMLDFAYRIADTLDWPDAAAATLERVLAIQPDNPAALRALDAYYRQTKNLPALRDLSIRRAQLEPGNPAIQNEELLTRLLLSSGNPATNLADALKLVEDRPGSADYQTTYALALYRNGDFQGAARIFEKMSPTDRLDTERTLYYGMALAELGERNKAIHELDAIQSQLDTLFPEQELMYQNARTRATSTDDTNDILELAKPDSSTFTESIIQQ